MAERGFLVLHARLTEPILQIGCPSYHLTSWISDLTQKPSAQIPNPFHQQGNADQGTNALTTYCLLSF